MSLPSLRNATRSPGSKAALAGRISNPAAWTRRPSRSCGRELAATEVRQFATPKYHPRNNRISGTGRFSRQWPVFNPTVAGFGIPGLNNLHRNQRRRAAPDRACMLERPPWLVTWGSMDDDLEQLRDRAARLFALALRAEEDGRTGDAKELVQLASEALRARAGALAPSDRFQNRPSAEAW
jgi:hypothetical protein